MKTLGKRKDMLRPWFWFLLHNVNSSECNLCDGHCLRNKLGGLQRLGVLGVSKVIITRVLFLC